MFLYDFWTFLNFLEWFLVNLVARWGPEGVQMEAGLRTRRIREVDRTWRLYRGLYEVAEVAFLRAGSHGRALCNIWSPRPLPPFPLPWQSHPGNPSLSWSRVSELILEWITEWVSELVLEWSQTRIQTQDSFRLTRQIGGFWSSDLNSTGSMQFF